MSNSRRLIFGLALVPLLLAGPRSYSAELIGSDAIGTTSLWTDFNGGFPAMDGGPDVIGQPAVEVNQNGASLFDSMRVIVHAVESSQTHRIHFDFFEYKLKVWTKANYFAGLNPQLVADLGEPIGITLIQPSTKRTIPSEHFGEASYDSGVSIPSYDFRFDLTTATVDGSPFLAFDEPLPAGDYIVAFQSRHNASNGGIYLSLSTGGGGLAPYFHQHVYGITQHPRGILVGQPPPYEYRWGWNIFQTQLLPGDYNGDEVVNAADYVVWRDNIGAPAGTLDNDIDGGPIGSEQYNTWRANFGARQREVELLRTRRFRSQQP